ncbi:MAG TPA: pantoate--beta-alanine ligase [Gemmataceae bacterium]|nr:pantoate--beta-alanine ligase [Gemmataceae bacterium]
MLPPLATTIAEVRRAVTAARAAGKRVGFVPTMGALHAGHAALIRAARAEAEFVVVSIFVNPTQFGPNEDYSRYPRTLDADRELCAAVGTDVIFHPTPDVMYPAGTRTVVQVTGLQDVLDGPSRPEHFKGVATVVLKLFNIVQPDVAVFGQKDAQQALIIRRMAADLDLPLTVRVHPTVRESDGLAMSSRNRYLDPTQRQNATCLVRALRTAEALVAGGERSVAALEAAMTAVIVPTTGARVDYVRILSADLLEPMEVLDRPALAAVAVFFGLTRLIDNVTLLPPH